MVINFETKVADAVRRELLDVDMWFHHRQADPQNIDLFEIVDAEKQTLCLCNSIGVVIVEHTACCMLCL